MNVRCFKKLGSSVQAVALSLGLLYGCTSGVSLNNNNPSGNENNTTTAISPKLGAKSYRQIRSGISNLAGFPVASNPASCSNEYIAAKASLPVNTNLDSMSVATINATADLARCYGALFSANATAVSQYAPINLSLPASQALTPALVDQFAQALVLASFGPGNHADLVNEVKTMMNQLIPLAPNTSSVLTAAFATTAIGVLKY